MSLRLLRFLNWSDWAGKVLKEGCGLFVCLFLSINTIQGDGGSHSQADQKCQPSDWKGRYPSDQAVHTQRWRGSHQREQTPAITRSEFFWLPRPQKKETRVTLFGLKMDNTYDNLVIIHFLCGLSCLAIWEMFYLFIFQTVSLTGIDISDRLNKKP